LDLRADCSRCAGLCCVAPSFSASADFAIDKAAGRACPHLRTDFRCDIHRDLRQRGFPGCAVYDCFGAGQQVTQVTFGGADWRRDPRSATQMFDVFTIMRQLHELAWYITEALRLTPTGPPRSELATMYAETVHLTHGEPEALLALDVEKHRQSVNVLLRQASERARAAAAGTKADHGRADHSGADLVGANLVGADLRGASLRGAYLLGADLGDADLHAADLTGADLRSANLAGADLSGSLFLTQAQLDAATGDVRTKIPPSLTRPAHWSTATTGDGAGLGRAQPDRSQERTRP
ncbi:MAG TPA: pentapeptide repeat-containing protein, partial [Actinopolymorphaceae bacterium]|nr:pentapeptide repeat-containing protein [Actinopolymorphaceae bacterium]